MITVVLALLLLIALLNWIKWQVATRALTHWLVTKNYTPPTDEEMSTCSTYVVKKMLRH